VSARCLFPPNIPTPAASCRSPGLTHTCLDAGDESLQRYKESLGLGGGRDLSDPRDPRVCIIHSLTMETAGRPPVTIDLSTPGSEATLKEKPFRIKEGAKFTMVASFRVQHEILSGLHYVQIVKRKGIKVSKDSEMIVRRGRFPPPASAVVLTMGAQGSYAPNTDKQPMYQKRCTSTPPPTDLCGWARVLIICAVQEEEAPTGMLVRGHYNAISTFVDDDKKEHLKFEWSFDIAKDW